MKSSRRGFTLLELLISMSMLVVILVITMGALRLGSRSVAAGERRMEEQERFRTVLAILDSQIQSQLPLTYDAEHGKRYYFRGDGRTLRIATGHSIREGLAGYVIVDYRIESDGQGKEVLLAREQVPGIEGGVDTRLIEADRMAFDYFYRDPAEERGRWLETLDDGLAIPQKVRLRMISRKTEWSDVFPVRVEGTMRPVAGGARP